MIYEDFSSLDHTKTRAQHTATCGCKIYDSALRKIDDENIIKSSLALNCFLKLMRIVYNKGDQYLQTKCMHCSTHSITNISDICIVLIFCSIRL